MVQFRQDPAVRQRQVISPPLIAILIFGIHQYSGWRSIVAVVTVTFRRFISQLISRPVEASAARVTQGVGTVRLMPFGNCFGAFGDFSASCGCTCYRCAFFQQLRQEMPSTISSGSITLPRDLDILAFVIADQTGHIDGLNPAAPFSSFDEVHGHHDHAGNPEEDDVEAGTITLVGWN